MKVARIYVFLLSRKSVAYCSVANLVECNRKASLKTTISNYGIPRDLLEASKASGGPLLFAVMFDSMSNRKATGNKWGI